LYRITRSRSTVIVIIMNIEHVQIKVPLPSSQYRRYSQRYLTGTSLFNKGNLLSKWSSSKTKHAHLFQEQKLNRPSTLSVLNYSIGHFGFVRF
jgi:hypothetical protein